MQKIIIIDLLSSWCHQLRFTLATPLQLQHHIPAVLLLIRFVFRLSVNHIIKLHIDVCC